MSFYDYYWSGVYHRDLYDTFAPPLQPSPAYTEDGTGFVDYEIVPLFGDGDLTAGNGLMLVDSDTAAALVAPWDELGTNIVTQLSQDPTDGHSPEIYLRWVDADNHLVFTFARFVGQPWRIIMGSVVDGFYQGYLGEWQTELTTLAGAQVQIDITSDRVTVWSGSNFFISEAELISGSRFTAVHRGATKAGLGLRLWPGYFRFLYLRFRAVQATPLYLSTGADLVTQTAVPMPAPPTLTAGGDIVQVQSGLGLAQLLATTDHLKLRRRPASLGGNPPRAAALQGVLQPIAGSPEGAYGTDDGVGDEARFNLPISLRFASDDSTLFVADHGNASIRAIEIPDDAVSPGTVTTVANLVDLPINGGPAAQQEYRPKHISYDSLAKRLAVSCDWGVIDIQHVGELNQYVEVLRVSQSPIGISPAPDKFGSIVLYPGGRSGLVKHPVGDYVSGWYTIFFEPIGKYRRGDVLEEPEPPNPKYCDPPKNTKEVVTVHWRDGAYSDDGGLMLFPNTYYYPARYSTLMTHSYIYPNYNGLGVSDFPWGGGIFKRPYNYCAPDPIPLNWEQEPAGYLFVRTGSPSTGYYERELSLGPEDPRNNDLPTAISPLWTSDVGVIQRTTIDLNQQEDFVVAVNYDHSRGLSYIPTMSIAYARTRGVYYMTLGDAVDHAGETLGWPLNRIVALDLYAPDYVTGDLELPDVTPFIERTPDPIETEFTPAGSGEATGIGLSVRSLGGTARIPIGVTPGAGQPETPIGDFWLDDDNAPLVDENGNPILLS